YFKDKNEILYALHEIGFQKMVAMNGNLAEIENPLMRLYKMGENYIEFGLASPEFYDIMFIQHAPMEVLNEMENCDWTHGEHALDALKQTVGACMEQGFLKKGNIEAASMAIWSMVHGMVSLAIRERFDKLCPPANAFTAGESIKNMM